MISLYSAYQIKIRTRKYTDGSRNKYGSCDSERTEYKRQMNRLVIIADAAVGFEFMDGLEGRALTHKQLFCSLVYCIRSDISTTFNNNITSNNENNWERSIYEVDSVSFRGISYPNISDFQPELFNTGHIGAHGTRDQKSRQVPKKKVAARGAAISKFPPISELTSHNYCIVYHHVHD